MCRVPEVVSEASEMCDPTGHAHKAAVSAEGPMWAVVDGRDRSRALFGLCGWMDTSADLIHQISAVSRVMYR